MQDEGSRHVAKRSSEWPRGSLPRRQSSGTGHSASCGYWTPFAPRRPVPGEIRYPLWGPCADCRRILWVPGPRGQYSGKIRFIEKPGIQYESGRRSSDPRVAYSEVQVRDLVWVVGIVAPFAPRGSVLGENSFYRAIRGKMGTGDLCRVPPTSGTPRENQAKFRDVAVWGL